MRSLSLQACKMRLRALLLILVIPLAMMAQTKKEIKGVVTDSKGQPAAAVTVNVKGTNTNVVTKADGSFTIRAAEGEVLVFSAVNFAGYEQAVGSTSVVNVSLQDKVGDLNDVVVVGYGKSSRKTLTSAVTSMKQDDLNRGAISDVGQLLQGKVPGMNITASGDPNRPSAVILRGASTINSSQSPFYVIDGVIGADISAIAPDDIVTMDILKDAAATAIYGSRGANGVIIITTKRGKKGASVVTYGGYVGQEKVSNKLDMMNADELRAFTSKNGLVISPADEKGANTNWQEAVQRNAALSQNHNLSFSGGGEHGTYSASINYYNKEGIVQSSSLRRIIGRLAIEQYALNDKLKFNLMVSNSNSDANNVPYRNTVLSQMITYLPVSPVKNADGSYFDNFQNTSYYNPASIIAHGKENSKYNTLIANFNTQVRLPFGLTYDLNLSYQNLTSLNGAYYDSYFTQNYNNVRNTPEPPANPTFVTLGGAKNGYALRNTYQNTTKILESYFTWNRAFGDHSVNAVLGYSWQETINGDGFQATSSNFPVDDISYNNLVLGNPYAISDFRVNFGDQNAYQQSRLISDFFRLNYNYKEKYLLQASVRRDGGSVFGANNKWGYFPAVGLAWRINKEAFMAQQHLFQDLKLRASYGVTGNASGFSPYTAQFISSTSGTFYYNGVQLGGYGPSQAANNNLKWEKTATANIGVDFSVLGGKLSGTLDVYSKKTTDMIYGYNINPTQAPTGRIIANGGEMSNKGIELSLSATPVNSRGFVWSTTLNLAHNRNRIVSMSNPVLPGVDSIPQVQPDGSGQTGSTLQLLKAGKPLGQFFTLEYAGKNAAGVTQFVDGKGGLTTAPLIGTDYHYLGDAQPRLMAGFANNFRYKNFDLNIFFRGVFGNKIFNVTRADLFRPTTASTANILREVANESVSDGNVFKYSSRFIENGSFVRLDNATLGYNFRNVSSYVKSLRVYASVNNLFVITGYKGIDPEINQGGNAPGVDANNFYPKTRTILLGVNVSF